MVMDGMLRSLVQMARTLQATCGFSRTAPHDTNLVRSLADGPLPHRLKEGNTICTLNARSCMRILATQHPQVAMHPYHESP